MGRLFGTDGIRGIANTELTCKLASNVAKATSAVVAEDLGKEPSVLVGMDTRISGKMLQAAINSGLCSVGSRAINLEVVPTPAVAYLVANNYADIGIMISASHNPFDFNGIKIFGVTGFKLTDEQEFEIEAMILDKTKPYPVCWGDDVGTISQAEELLDHYIDHLVESVEEVDLSGFHVALDCSNGSASKTAKRLFDKLGIQTTIIHAEPDGININDHCGSTHIESLAECVRQGNYDAGFAFDGDADRCLMVDEKGTPLSGDVILAILALDLKEQGKLKDNTLVATIMSNMGLFKFAEAHGIQMKITKVGDRYVLEEMLKQGYSLGGEESGHVILRKYMNTGDGQLTALHVLAAMKRSGSSLSELAKCITIYPQVMKNIHADATMKSSLAVDKGAQLIIQRAEESLGSTGRILVRPSGTEPVIRVMIEGQNQEEIQLLLNQVCDDLKERLALNETNKRLTDIQ